MSQPFKNFVGTECLELEASPSRESEFGVHTPAIVCLLGSHGPMRIQVSMLPDEARRMAIELVKLADSLDRDLPCAADWLPTWAVCMCQSTVWMNFTYQASDARTAVKMGFSDWSLNGAKVQDITTITATRVQAAHEPERVV